MVFKLKPLDLSLDFEDRPYDLGETIDITVELTPNGDVDVREGRLELVCEERYAQTAVSFIPDTYAPLTPGGLVISGKTGHVATQRKERFVHSSMSFLEATSLSGGAATSRRAKLLIQSVPPPHMEEARALERDANSAWSFKWTLVASVNVVRGRDPRRQRAVKVKLPGVAVARRVGPKPRMSTPKKATGPSS